jgi:hypothetical protein
MYQDYRNDENCVPIELHHAVLKEWHNVRWSKMKISRWTTVSCVTNRFNRETSLNNH